MIKGCHSNNDMKRTIRSMFCGTRERKRAGSEGVVRLSPISRASNHRSRNMVSTNCHCCISADGHDSVVDT